VTKKALRYTYVAVCVTVSNTTPVDSVADSIVDRWPHRHHQCTVV